MIKSGILVPRTAMITQTKSISFPRFLAEIIPSTSRWKPPSPDHGYQGLLNTGMSRRSGRLQFCSYTSWSIQSLHGADLPYRFHTVRSLACQIHSKIPCWALTSGVSFALVNGSPGIRRTRKNTIVISTQIVRIGCYHSFLKYILPSFILLL